jgi:cell division protein FtsQ
VRLLLAGEAAPEHLAELLLLLQDARPIRERVRTAVYVGQRRWNLTLDDGLTIKLPADDAGAALQRLLALDKSDRLLSRDLSVVDLRLPGMLILRRRGLPDPLQSVADRPPARVEPAPPSAPGPRPATPVKPAAGPNNNARKAAQGNGGQRQ